MPAMQPALIALDWGTSSLRAYLMGPGGTVIETRRLPLGLMHVPGRDFGAVMDQAVGDWRRAWPELRAIAAGMIGSAQGWVEAPYDECPSGVAELARALVPVPGGALRVVPGVARFGAAPNMMRGEETQIVGALAQQPSLAAQTLFVLPGTHSKWASVSGGQIQDFQTFMTGEVFATLREHSILGRFARPDAPPPEGGAAREAFAHGVSALRDGGPSAAPLLFSARSLVLAGQLRPEQSLEYLSGLLIGEEIRCGLQGGGASPVLVGDAGLCERYRRAFSLFGIEDVAVLGDTAAAGLWCIADLAGLTGRKETRA